MNAGLNDRDWELISAYLDSSLPPAETLEVEARLIKEPVFNAAYESLRRTRAILRAVPDVKRRKNFYLTPQLARQGKWTWIIPVFNYSSLATGLVAVILMVMNLLPVGMKSAPAPQAMMPAPAMLEASAPVAGNSAAKPAAEATAPTMESKQEISTLPVVEKDAQTQADQAVVPSMELAAPAPATGAVSGEQAQPLPTTPVENFVAPAPPAVAEPVTEGENQTSVTEVLPEMKAAGGGAVSEPASGILMDSAPVENGMERQKFAPTMTLEPLMEATPEEATATTEPTLMMFKAAVPLWTAEAPTITREAPPISTPTVQAAVEITPTVEAVTPVINSPTAIPVTPDIPVPTINSQPAPGGKAESSVWMGGILLLVSVALAFAGFVVKKRLR